MEEMSILPDRHTPTYRDHGEDRNGEEEIVRFQRFTKMDAGIDDVVQITMPDSNCDLLNLELS